MDRTSVSGRSLRTHRGPRLLGALCALALVGLGASCVPPPPNAVLALGGSSVSNCALYGNGAVYCWGANSLGELGRGAVSADDDNPAPVVGLPPVFAITAGVGDHSCALATRGIVWCWGSNDRGQLGPSSFSLANPTPVRIPGLDGVASVSAGKNHTCVTMAVGGTVKCWGANDFGQLGDGTTSDSKSPVDVVGISGAVRVSAGGDHTCALLNDFTVRCWGFGGNGQLGNGSSGPSASSALPVQVITGSGSALTGVTQLSAGLNHTCAIVGSSMTGDTPRPAVYCWGNGTSGQLGNASNTSSAVAVPAASLAQSPLAGVTAIRSDWYHTCAGVQQSDNAYSLVCWGKTPGNGSGVSNNIRTLVAPFSQVASIASLTGGFDDSCALVTRSNRSVGNAGNGSDVYCWGNNRNLQLGNTGPTTFVPQIVFGLPLFL